MSTHPLNNASPLSIMFPGRIVTIVADAEDVPPLKVTVRPLGFMHIIECHDAMVYLIEAVLIEGKEYIQSHAIEWRDVPEPDGAPSRLKVPSDEWLLGLLGQVIPRVLPKLMAEAVPLLKKSVSGINLDDPACPHEVFPLLMDAWIAETFASEKRIRPWIAAAKRALAAIKTNPRSTSAMHSIFSSVTASANATSTSDGASPSSGTDSSEPSEPTNAS